MTTVRMDLHVDPEVAARISQYASQMEITTGEFVTVTLVVLETLFRIHKEMDDMYVAHTKTKEILAKLMGRI